MLRSLLAGMVAIVLAGAASLTHAQVNINIGIDLPRPPALVIIPRTPVAYAPAVPANIFFYGGQYYVFADHVWYVGPTYQGPWAGVALEHVPPPILAVPVRYYRAPPPAWKHWRRGAPPPWEAVREYGSKKAYKAYKEEEKALKKAWKEEEKEFKKERKEFEKRARQD